MLLSIINIILGQLCFHSQYILRDQSPYRHVINVVWFEKLGSAGQSSFLCWIDEHFQFYHTCTFHNCCWLFWCCSSISQSMFVWVRQVSIKTFHNSPVPPSIWTKLIAELKVPPVATKSSMIKTRSPFLILSLCTVRPLLFPYSVSYSWEEMELGILPCLRIMMNGFLSARAMGGPSMNPRASKLMSTHIRMILDMWLLQ